MKCQSSCISVVSQFEFPSLRRSDRDKGAYASSQFLQPIESISARSQVGIPSGR